MADREYICGYSHCLHNGVKVKSSEAVKVGKRYCHWDCVQIKNDIKDCVASYMEQIDDKTQFPTVTRIINTMVFENKVPIDFIKNNIKVSGKYYKTKPVYILYGIRKLFWEKEFKIK